MLSISRIDSLSHGLDYYSQDNYYAKEDQKEFSMWYGKTAVSANLSGPVLLKDFERALLGFKETDNSREKSGFHVLISNMDKENIIKSLDFIFDKYQLPNEKEEIEKIQQRIFSRQKKLSEKDFKVLNKKIFSILNENNLLRIQEKLDIKSEIMGSFKSLKKGYQRRLGFDLTFSAPKSVSLFALVNENKEILEAHRTAVQKSLDVLEKEYSYIRLAIKGKNEYKIETTENILTAMFEHDISRKVDPQLHTHCVVMNLTAKDDGKLRALHSDGFFQDSKKLGIIYQDELARQIQKLGYKIELNSNGTFEISGFKKDHLEQFSKRTMQLLEMGATSQKEKTRIIKNKRDKKEKNISRDELKEKWKQESQTIGLIFPQKELSQEMNSHRHSLEKIFENTMKDLNSKEVSFTESQFQISVMEKTLGHGAFNYENIKKESLKYLKNHSVSIGNDIKKEFVSHELLNMEKETVQILNRGKNYFLPIKNKNECQKIIENINLVAQKSGFSGLNDGQSQAVESGVIHDNF